MSSILDALNKLDDERERDAANARAALDAELAARDLMGEGDGPRYTVSLGPIALAAAGIALLLVVAATAAVVVWLVRAEPADVAAATSPAEIASAVDAAASAPAPPPEATAAAVASVDGELDAGAKNPQLAAVESPPALEEAATSAMESHPESRIDADGWAQALALSAGVSADELADVSVEKSPSDVPAARVRTDPSPQVAVPAATVSSNARPAADATDPPVPAEPPVDTAVENGASLPENDLASDGPVVVSAPVERSGPAPDQIAPPVPTLPRPAPEDDVQLNAFDVAAQPEEAAETAKDWPEDMRDLPALSPVAKAKLGLEEFVVNMPMPATNARPVASAIINRMKVYKNERVLNTRVRLVDVASHGITIEVIDTGDRYYVRH